LLFVADELPRELRRLIEFLNQQMVSVEVLGVEIRQYVRPDVKVLVPRLVGQTELTCQGKSQRRVQPPLDPQAFLNLMPPYARGFFQRFFSEAEQRRLYVEFTPKGCAVKLQYRTGGPTTLLYAYPPDMQGNALPEIRPYFECLAKRGEDVALMRERLMRVAPFQASGQYTLRLPISEDGLDTAEAAMREFLCIVRELAQR